MVNVKYDVVLYTPEDVKNITGFGMSKVYKLFKSNGFPALKIGHDYRVEKEKFNKWINDYTGREFFL